MALDKNIWAYAKSKVDNKGILARIGHSARFHSVRSAVNSKGSFGSKLLKGLGAVGRASFSLIPIPIIGSLLSSAEQAIEGKIRSWTHTRHGVGDPNYVKFALKEASVENLDRYRFKVEHSMQELAAAAVEYNNFNPAADTTNFCDAGVEFAMKVAQAQRRQRIFNEEILKLKGLMEASFVWSELVTASLDDLRKKAEKHFADVAEAESAALSTGTPDEQAAAVAALRLRHSKCGDFCPYKTNIAGGNWADFRAAAAAVVRELQAPFSADTFLAANKASFESANQLDNYKPKSERA
jgi:hypothetical protein